MSVAESSKSVAAGPSGVDVARGVLDSVVAPTATQAGYVVLAIPGSNYKLHLRPAGAGAGRFGAERVGKRATGRISVEARRIDLVQSGGRYVEPVHGRPRRVQGKVVAVDAGAGVLVVNAGGASAVDGVGLPVRVRPTDQRQNVGQFPVGSLVSMDVLEGATIE